MPRNWPPYPPFCCPRQEEEFAATLERERSKVELTARFQELKNAHDLRRAIRAEMLREVRVGAVCLCMCRSVGRLPLSFTPTRPLSTC